MNTFVRCGSLFTGHEDEPQHGGTLVFDPQGRILYAGPEAGAPRGRGPTGHWIIPAAS
jgi:hypothetical protein